MKTATISIWTRSTPPRIFEEAELIFDPTIGFVIIRVGPHDTYLPTADILRIDFELDEGEPA